MGRMLVGMDSACVGVDTVEPRVSPPERATESRSLRSREHRR